MKNRLLILFFVSITAILGLLVFQKVQAAFPGEGLTISPPISEPKVKPGESVTQTIRLTNPTAKIIEVYPRTMDFRAKGEGGEPDFYVATADSDKFSLSKWITYNPTKIVLTPEQVVEYQYTIKVPTDAEAGGHYGAVFFVSEPPKSSTESSKVSIGSMVGSLILVTVPGETIEKGIVDDFVTNLKLYLTGNTVNFSTRISNIGNVHFKPKGNIKVKSAFGGQTTTLTFNEKGGNVLPDTTRKFENSWKYKWYQVGYFKANLSLIYGTSEKTMNATTSFWILPWWFIIVLIILILLIIILVSWLIKRRKKTKTPQISNIPPPPPIAPQSPSGNPPILR